MGGVRKKAGAKAVTMTLLGLVLVVGLIAGPAGAAGNTVPSPGKVDLAVDFVTQPNPAPTGSMVQLEGVVRNVGTGLADQVIGVFEVSAASVSAQFGSNPCTAVGSSKLGIDGSREERPWTVTCDLGALPAGSEARISFSVKTGPPGTHLASVTASSGQLDDRPANNLVQVPIYVRPAAPEFMPAFQQPGRLNPSSRITT